MKISKDQLRQIIKEALNHALNEAVQTSGATGSKSHIEPLRSNSMREIAAEIKSQGKNASDYDFYKDPVTGEFSAHMKGTERRFGQSDYLMTATDVGDAFKSEDVATDPAELRRDLEQIDLEIYPDSPTGTPWMPDAAETGDEAIELEEPEVVNETLKRWKKLIK